MLTNPHQIDAEQLANTRYKIMQLIEVYGFTVIYTQNEQGIPYGCTVGMSVYGLPDIMVYNVRCEDAQSLLQTVANHYIGKDTKDIKMNELVTQIFDVPVKFWRANRESANLFKVKLWYDHLVEKTSGVIELRIPDMQGHFDDSAVY